MYRSSSSLSRTPTFHWRGRPPGGIARVTALAVSLGRRVAEGWRQKRAFDRLMSLSDRQLKDIGIHRSEILSVLASAGTAGHRQYRNVGF
jgi:uncharacterized protein YjiS (DUF1127 family)